MKNWKQISENTHRSWVVRNDNSDGCPLDWISERSFSELTERGLYVLPEPGKTVQDLIESKMLST